MVRLALQSNGGFLTTVNRTQALVISFFVAVWAALALILRLAPEIYVETLRPAGVPPAAASVGLFAGVTVLVAVLTLGVVRRWRWAFWLLLVVFLTGVLRVPAAVLELAGIAQPSVPAWYAVFQAVVGAVQFVIGVLLVRGYRRGGAWGRF
jgi:hypothetical protein